MWAARARRFARDEAGSTMVEMSLAGSLVLMMMLAILDFGLAFFQYNGAAKALQVGARAAAVSNPVSADLRNLTGLSDTVQTGDPMPAFRRVCSGATRSCSDGGVFDAAALRDIVYGRGNTSCAATPARPAMCNVFGRIRPENVVVEYVNTGLGYAGRPDGPVPTITVRLTNMNFNFVVLNGLFGLPPLSMSGMSATATGEDLSG